MRKRLFFSSILVLSFFGLQGQTNIFPSNGNVGIGTIAPTSKLDVVGKMNANQGNFTSNQVDNGQTYSSALDRNDKCVVLAAGSVIGTGTGYNNSRTFNFFDFPQSNIDPKSTVLFGIEDRADFGRYRFIAETGGVTQMIMLNKSQQEIMKIYEDGNDNVSMQLPKTNSRIVIGGLGDYLPQHKFVVRGSSKIEGNVLTDGNVGIGTNSFIDGVDSYRLSVNGAIRASRVKVYTGWADYVFEKDYKLPTLREVEAYIADKGHLPNIPSASEVERNGIELGEMAKLQQEKIEELTLYLIEQNKQIEELKLQVKELISKR